MGEAGRETFGRGVCGSPVAEEAGVRTGEALAVCLGEEETTGTEEGPIAGAAACVCMRGEGRGRGVCTGAFWTWAVFEFNTPALPPRASCPCDNRKGAGSRLPPEAFRCRGG